MAQEQVPGGWLDDLPNLQADGIVLVTGASGYIAGFIIKLLLEEGYTVRGTVRPRDDGSEPLSRYSHLTELDGVERLSLVEADLGSDEGWAEAVRGCWGVFHTASPFPGSDPEDEDELIRPAVEGTRRVLRACAAEESVKRVVVTSSVAAVAGGHKDANGRTFSEEDWSVEEEVKMYTKSKLLAERAAWEVAEEASFELATVNPVYVQGPLLSSKPATSHDLLRKMLSREIPALMKLSVNVVDVRDVALCHVRAMVTPHAAGKRFIAAADNGSLWLKEIAVILDDEFGPKGYSVPTTVLPYAFAWVVGRCDAQVKMMLPSINTITYMNNSQARDVLGVEFHDPRDTLITMANDLIRVGIVEDKTKGDGKLEE